MFLFKKFPLSAIALVLTLFACGGGSDGNGDETLTDVFIDSPVLGVEYSIGGMNGITNEAGKFKYPKGSFDKISFKIGKFVLGSSNPAPIVTPLDFVDMNDVNDQRRLINILRLLQTLDSDNDFSNGINISAAARANAPVIAESVLASGFFDTDTIIELTTTMTTTIGDFLIMTNGVALLIDQADAITHFNNQLSQLGESYNSPSPLPIDFDFDGVPYSMDNCDFFLNPDQSPITNCPEDFCGTDLGVCSDGAQVVRDPLNGRNFCPCPTAGTVLLPCPDFSIGILGSHNLRLVTPELPRIKDYLLQ